MHYDTAYISYRVPTYRNPCSYLFFLFFFNDTATTEIYTLSLHDALPICCRGGRARARAPRSRAWSRSRARSEEHTSELQSHVNLVCRLLLEKKKQIRAVRPDEPCRRIKIYVRTPRREVLV